MLWDSIGLMVGLPQNSVNTILQAKDGFIWFTSEAGDLIKYEDDIFEVFNNENGLPVKKLEL